MKRIVIKICACALAIMIAAPALAAVTTPPETAAPPHWYWFIDLNEGNFRIRDTTADGTNPNGGAVRCYFPDRPAEVNTNVWPPGGAPFSGTSDIIGNEGQSATDYCAMVQTTGMATSPSNGEEIIFIMELDANVATSPRTYMNNGVQIGAVPHGYIWAGSEIYDSTISDEEVLPSGSPPTTFFEALEMAPPETIYGDSWTWAGLKYAQPGDVAGNVLGQIAFWGLLEGAPGGGMNGPWTEVGQAAFGSPINYMQVFDRYYCAVPYFKGGGTPATSVRSLVYSQPGLFSGHYPSRATGPVGTSNSASLTITFEANCGCFGDQYLYYSNDRNVTWNFIDIFYWTDWVTMYYPWIAPGNGEYWWYTADEGLMDYPSSGTPAEAGPYTITQLFQVDDLMAFGHTPTNMDIRLTWTEKSGATGYNIYRSLSVTGTGFNFGTAYAVVPPSGTGTVVWDDVGAYADANNYAWVVRAVYSGTEATEDLDNIAFKLVKTIFQGTGTMGATDNYIALPYRYAHTTAFSVLSDIRQYGSPINAVSSINNWNQDTGAWESRSMFAGGDFAITPGKGYRVVATVASVTWKIVGAYDSTVANNLFVGMAAIGASDNYIALPYHSSLATASDLVMGIRTDGTPVNSITSVNRWNQNTGAWEAKIAFAGINFAITPGEAYRVVATQSCTWTPPVTMPGP